MKGTVVTWGCTDKNTARLKPEAAQTFQSLIEITKQTLSSGEDILISGSGEFRVKENKERKGRNPQTGKDLMLDKRRVITFKCSGNLRKKLNTRKKKRKNRK